jgi:trimethylamine:corrinoid methyltransferase-like protein
MRRSWAADGSRTLAQRVRAKVRDIVEHHEPLPLPDGLEKSLNEIIARAEAAG